MVRGEIPDSIFDRPVGILILVIIQIHNGIIHTVSGLVLLFATEFFSISPIDALTAVFFNVYTLLYGVFCVVFAYGLWMKKRWGWIGTLVISFAVIFPFSIIIVWNVIRGSPSFTGVFDTIYSIVLVVYLSQPSIRRVFSKTK